MAKFPVFIFPGYLASDLGTIATGQVIWWDPSVAMLLSLGKLRLAANGIDPGPPDGVPIATSTTLQDPWPAVVNLLVQQLDPNTWNPIACTGYDWRLDYATQAKSLSDSLATHVDPKFPATLVAHSMGGLILVMAWANLLAVGKQHLIRRIITLGTPFQGSYLPVLFINGTLGSAQQLQAIGQIAVTLPLANPVVWTATFINNVALSFPSLYQALPSLVGSEAANDPNRSALYKASNWNPALQVSQAWLDYAANTTQPLLAGPTTFPPSDVMTCVYGTGCPTPYALQSPNAPLNLLGLSFDNNGDGVVHQGSAIRTNALVVQVTSSHSSIPLGTAQTGDLASWITDPRSAPLPVPPMVTKLTPILANVTDPPEADPVTQLVCVGGG